MKKPQDEQQLWALCYATASALLTLGSSVHHGLSGTHSAEADHIDARAAAIADKATKRLKGKLP